MFYGGGYYDDEEQTSAAAKPAVDTFSKEGSCPLCGDPVDDKIVEARLVARKLGVSRDEFVKKVNSEPNHPNIAFDETTITVDGYPLTGLPMAERAFYILLYRHPVGIKPGTLNSEHLGEYQEIYNSLKGQRRKKIQNGISFDLDKRAAHYKNTINRTISKIENDENVTFSLAKVYLINIWSIPAASRVFTRNLPHIADRKVRSNFAENAGLSVFLPGEIPEL